MVSECSFGFGLSIKTLFVLAKFLSDEFASPQDPCGAAGGRYPGTGSGRAGATFVPTSVAKLGDMGSSLPAAPSATIWTAGTDVEVSWTQKAWHGGGYSYRLCPASSNLTEECFQAHPLNFVGNS
jgi:hypothetical protein